MKNHFVWTIIILTSLSACTMDRYDNQTGGTDPNAASRAAGYPENPQNPYDVGGQLHFDLSDAYLSGGYLTQSYTDAIAQSDALCRRTTEFEQLRPADYAPVTATRLAYLLEDKPGRVAEAIDQLSLSWRAKVSLANFISTVQWYRDQNSDYDTIYRFAVSYEDSILSDTSLASDDVRILLTTASITRYAFYFSNTEKKKEPKRRDRDWDISMGNITAAADGANESTAKAISMSVAAALYVNR